MPHDYNLNGPSKAFCFLDIYSEKQEQVLLELAAKRGQNVFIAFGKRISDPYFSDSIPMRLIRRCLLNSLSRFIQDGSTTFVFHTISYFSAMCAELLNDLKKENPHIRYVVLPLHNIYNKPSYRKNMYDAFLSGAENTFAFFSPESTNLSKYYKIIRSICAKALLIAQPQEYTGMQRYFSDPHQQTQITFLNSFESDLEQFQTVHNSIGSLAKSIMDSFDYKNAKPVHIDFMLQSLREQAVRWNALSDQLL